MKLGEGFLPSLGRSANQATRPWGSIFDILDTEKAVVQFTGHFCVRFYEEDYFKMASTAPAEASELAATSSRPQQSSHTATASTGGASDRRDSPGNRRTNSKNFSRGKSSRGRGGRQGKTRDMGRSAWK